jgi:phthiocerol/phenolphthiocerol synthesis type-I polyketide synthase E
MWKPSGGSTNRPMRRLQHDDELLEEILAIWKDGIGEEQIGADTSFADAGADSLTTIEVVDRINRTYGSAISVTQSLANVTPQELAALVLGREVRSSTPWASYVRYRSAHAKTVFLAHPAGGSTFCYSALSRRLIGDVNLCAIDLPEGYEGYTSLNAIALRYAALVKTYQPAGPYHLGGYSFGGNLAHELARVLEQEGSVVETVFMFDSHPPEAYNVYDGSELDYAGAFPTLVASYFKPELIEIATREGEGVRDLTAAVELVRRLGILRSSISNEDIARFFARWVFSHNLLKAHRPATKVDAGLIIFVAREDEPPILLEKLKINSVSKAHWSKYFTHPVRSVLVDGDHFTMFSESRHLKNLAKEFDAVLQVRREVRQRVHEELEWARAAGS